MATESSPGDSKLYQGNIYVNSDPQGSKIYLDDKNSGYITPDSVKGVSFGNHKLKLVKSIFPDTTMDINVQAGIANNYFVNYYTSGRNYGSISCASMPSGATIFLNGNNLHQTTPYEIKNLFAGNYNVSLALVGYRTGSFSLTLRGSISSTVFLALQDTTVWLDYRINNSNIPSNDILDIKSDSKNNIWLITASNGIAKYVNGHFVIYNKTNSPLPGNFTTSLTIDPQDNIWIGTDSGLAKFDGTSWTIFNTGNSILPDNYISALYYSSDSKLWIGTPNGLVSVDNGNFYVYNTSNSGIYSNIVASIVMDKNGKMWIACAEGISTLFNGKWESFTRDTDGLAGFSSNCLSIDNTGIVWAAFPQNSSRGAAGGVMKYENNVWQSVNIVGIHSGSINCIYFDQNGGKWFGADNGVLYIKSNGVTIVYSGSSYAMYSNKTMKITSDKQNNIWFALFGGGIVKYKH